LHDLPAPFSAEIAKVGVLEALRKEIYGELGAAFDEIIWKADHQTVEESKGLSSLSGEVLFAAAREVARNAAHHGRASEPRRPLRLEVVATWRDGLELVVKDDGVGVSTRNAANDGHGLGLYGALLAVVGGSLTIEEVSDGTKVVVRCPPYPGAPPPS
jgi:signal transduction histidine kinase